jgi:putative transposase
MRPRPEGEWHPSNELFSLLGVQPVVYANAVKAAKAAAKAAKAQTETGGRPPVTPLIPLTPRQEVEMELNLDEPVVEQLIDIFNEE